MKKIFFFIAFLSFSRLVAQVPENVTDNNTSVTGKIVGGAQVLKFTGNPNKINSIKVINEQQFASLAWDTLNNILWEYKRALPVGKRWKKYQRLEYSNGTPTTGSRDTAYKFVVDTIFRKAYICNQVGCVEIGASAAVTVTNGISLSGSNAVQLGGVLSQPTTIFTDATNVLKVRGLVSTLAGDSLVTVDPFTGQLRRRDGSGLMTNSAALGMFKTKIEYDFDTAITNAEMRNNINYVASKKIATTIQFSSLSMGISEVVETAGFSDVGDGGAAKYLIVASGTADNMTTFQITDGKFAKLQANSDNGINIQQLGAKINDGIDDVPMLIKGLSMFGYVYSNAIGYFSLKSPILMSSNQTIVFGKDTELRQDSLQGANLFAYTNGTQLDTSITIKGGRWIRANGATGVGSAIGMPNGVAVDYGFCFTNVKDLRLVDMYVGNIPKFAFSISKAENVYIKAEVNTKSDGIHVMGKSDKIFIDLRGVTGDDFIALSGSDYTGNNFTKGNITNVDIIAHPYRNSGGNIVAIFPGNENGVNFKVENINIHDSEGTTIDASALSFAQYGANLSGALDKETFGGTINNVTVTNCKFSSSGSFLKFGVDTATNIKLTNVTDLNGKGIKISKGFVDNLNINGYTTDSLSAIFVDVRDSAKVKNIYLDGVHVKSGATSFFQFQPIVHSTPTINISNSNFTSSNGLATSNVTVDSVTIIETNVKYNTGTAWTISQPSFTYYLNNTDFSNCSYIPIYASGTGGGNIYACNFKPNTAYPYTFRNVGGTGVFNYLSCNDLRDNYTRTNSGTYTLPDNRATGSVFRLRNYDVAAKTTVSPQAGETINGGATYLLNANEGVTFRKITATNWETETSGGNTSWILGANTTSADNQKFGTASNHNVMFVTNNTERGRLWNDGVWQFGPLTSLGATVNISSNTSYPLIINSTVGGLVVPRMTGAQRDVMSANTDGSIIYNTTTNKLQVRAGGAWADLH